MKQLSKVGLKASSLADTSCLVEPYQGDNVVGFELPSPKAYRKHLELSHGFFQPPSPFPVGGSPTQCDSCALGRRQLPLRMRWLQLEVAELETSTACPFSPSVPFSIKI